MHHASLFFSGCTVLENGCGSNDYGKNYILTKKPISRNFNVLQTTPYSAMQYPKLCQDATMYSVLLTNWESSSSKVQFTNYQ